jgi:DNA-binding transcriptional ArsR family regulator
MLMEISSSLVRNLPLKAKAIVSGTAKQTTEFDQLYVVGQLAFAQHFAAVIASKRPQKDFMDLLESDWAAPYLDALHSRDLSSTQLAEVIGVSKESVSRNLRRLREAGIADFKKKGAFTINYLTNAASEVWSAVISEKPITKIEQLRNERSKIEDGTTHAQTAETVRDMLKCMTGGVPAHMNKMPTMDAPA